MKLVRLIEMYFYEKYSKVCISKHLSDNFPIQNGLKHGDALSPLLFNLSKHLSDNFPIQNGLKHGDALSPLLFNFALEYEIRNI
jgi:hypothetical protein